MKPKLHPLNPKQLRLAAVGLFLAASAGLCLAADHYTTTQVQAVGANWNGAIWQLNGAGDLVLPTSTSDNAELVFNGTTINGGNNTRVRTPIAFGVATFPFGSLTLDTNTELRSKGPGVIMDFPGPGGGLPGLILKGGLLNVGDDGDFPITGIISVVQRSYISPSTSGGGRSWNIKAQLTGSADLVLMRADLTTPQKISGTNNPFNGQWFIRAGWLVANAPGALGTNNITVDPNYALDPALGGITGNNGPALLDAWYDLNSAGTLTLANAGKLAMNANYAFAAVVINGTSLAAGTYSGAALAASYPANIVSGQGTLTVQPYNPGQTWSPLPPSYVSTPGLIWQSRDLGGPAYAGSTVSNADGTLTISGSGGDIWGTGDQCQYFYAWATGSSWDALFELHDFTGPDYWSKCELMVRVADGLAGPQGNDAFIANMATQVEYSNAGTGNTARNGVVHQFRTQRGGNADWKQQGNDPRPSFPGTWMRIHRQGSVFSIYWANQSAMPSSGQWVKYSDIDTASTTLVGQDNGTTFGTPFPDLVAVGIAVTAHNNGTPTLGVANVAHLTATFPATQPPTALGVTQQIRSGVTNYLGSEASLSFTATNNAVPQVVSMSYQWYKNGSIITNATASVHTWLLDNSDNGALYTCRASVPAQYGVTPLTSATATIGVLPGVQHNGLKMEFFANTTSRTAVEYGNVNPASSLAVEQILDDAGGYGPNYVSRSSGWFIPPTTDNYVFFVACDDDSDLFLSTDATAPNKRMVAQETGWSGTRNWLTVGGGTLSQKRTDQFTDPVTGAIYTSGIPLTGNQPYYIELVHHNGGGGDNFAATYQTATQMADPNWTIDFTNGVRSLLSVTNNNITFLSYPATTLSWVIQPVNTTVTEGLSGTFNSQAASDSEFAIKYQWYTVTPPAAIPGANQSSYFIPNVTSGMAGRQFYSVATTAFGELSITSSVATLTLAPPVFEVGWSRVDWWYGGTNSTPAGYENKAAVENGSSPPPDFIIASPRFEAGVNGESGNAYVNRVSGLFTAPATDNYVFFVNSDDDSDLYISTDSSSSNKVMVAQETGYSGSWTWLGVGGGTSTAAQKRSDQFVDPVTSTQPYPSGIPMTVGQKYYLEVVHHEGGGGDNLEVTFKKISDPDPANGTDSALQGSLVGMNVPRCTFVAFTQQPINVTVPLGSNATLRASGTTDSKVAVGPTGDPRPFFNNKIMYQWYRNGTAIAGATASAYSFGPVSPLDSAASFTCQIRAMGYVDNSLNPIWSNSSPATVTVSGSPVYETGFSLHSYYALNPSRAAIENNTAGNPTWIMASPAFTVGDTGVEVADNFSDALNAFFIPQTTGDYVFFCNADDDTDLLLGTDNSSITKRIVALETGAAGGALQWSTGNATQHRSDSFIDPSTGTAPYASGIHLLSGQKYFIQLAHHQGGGNTYSCVTAKLIGDPDPANGAVSSIRAGQLGCYVPRCNTVTVTNQPQSITVNSYASATFSASGSTDSITPIGPEGDWRNSFNNFLTFQWYKSGQPVAGATTSTLTLPSVLPSDNGAPITCQMRALGYADGGGNPIWASSSTATLTVITGAPPTLLYSAIYTNNTGGIPSTYVTLSFSGPMDPAALGNPANYILGGGLTISSIIVNSNGYRNVTLIVSGTPSGPFNVTINNASGLGGGPPLTGSNTTPVHSVGLILADIGIAGDPAVPSGFFPTGTNAYTVQCEGSDIWNNNDGFNFLYEEKTGDFDVVVRQLDMTKVSNWTKGGLMIRESTDPYSRNWNIVNDPNNADGIMAIDGSGTGANAVECNARSGFGQGSASWTTGPTAPPAYSNAWVRLTRQTTVGSDIITGYYGSDGRNWVMLGQTDTMTNGDMTPLPATVLVGICSTAHDNDTPAHPPYYYLNTAHYADYSSKFVSSPRLTIVRSDATHVTVSWAPGGGRLQASPALAGPAVNWQSLGTANPAVVPITAAPQYFRVANP